MIIPKLFIDFCVRLWLEFVFTESCPQEFFYFIGSNFSFPGLRLEVQCSPTTLPWGCLLLVLPGGEAVVLLLPAASQINALLAGKPLYWWQHQVRPHCFLQQWLSLINKQTNKKRGKKKGKKCNCFFFFFFSLM